MVWAVRLADKSTCINLSRGFLSHQAAHLNLRHSEWSSTGLSETLGVTAAGLCRVREKSSQPAGGEGSRPAWRDPPMCACPSRGSRNRLGAGGDAGSGQLPGQAQLGTSSSQLAPGVSLSTLAWAPTWGHKIKTGALRNFGVLVLLENRFLEKHLESS